jgi:hypothetical protein
MEFHPLLDLLIPQSHTPSELVHRIRSNIHNRAILNRYKDALTYWNKHELHTKAFPSLEQTSKEEVEELLYKYVRVFNKMFFSEGLPPHRYKLVLVPTPQINNDTSSSQSNEMPASPGETGTRDGDCLLPALLQTPKCRAARCIWSRSNGTWALVVCSLCYYWVVCLEGVGCES